MKKTHIEFPMLSNKILCGGKRKRDMKYTWATNSVSLGDATCKRCIKLYVPIKKKMDRYDRDDFEKRIMGGE